MMKASLLVYDIPERRGIRNPSGRLRRLGVRINLSCWVLPDDRIPWPLLNGLREQGADWKLAEFNPADAENLLNIVKGEMKKNIKAIGASCKRSLQSFAARMHRAATDGSVSADEAEKARKVFKVRTAAAVKRAQRLLRAIESAASGFGIKSAPNGQAARAHRAVLGLQAAAVARAQLYDDIAHGITDPALAQAALRGELPAGVLFDVAEDQGLETATARAAFAG